MEFLDMAMLLTIMAIIGKNQELPRERWKFYDHAAGVLIHHWDVERHLKDQNFRFKVAIESIAQRWPSHPDTLPLPCVPRAVCVPGKHRHPRPVSNSVMTKAHKGACSLSTSLFLAQN
jgi:hypothetical protein